MSHLAFDALAEPADAFGPDYAIKELLDTAENVNGLDAGDLRSLLPQLELAASLIECAKRKAEGRTDAH